MKWTNGYKRKRMPRTKYLTSQQNKNGAWKYEKRKKGNKGRKNNKQARCSAGTKIMQ